MIRTADRPITSSTSLRERRRRKCNSGFSLWIIVAPPARACGIAPRRREPGARRFDVGLAEPPDLRTLFESPQPSRPRPQAHGAIGNAKPVRGAVDRKNALAVSGDPVHKASAPMIDRSNRAAAGIVSRGSLAESV